MMTGQRFLERLKLQLIILGNYAIQMSNYLNNTYLYKKKVLYNNLKVYIRKNFNKVIY